MAHAHFSNQLHFAVDKDYEARSRLAKIPPAHFLQDFWHFVQNGRDFMLRDTFGKKHATGLRSVSS